MNPHHGSPAERAIPLALLCALAVVPAGPASAQTQAPSPGPRVHTEEVSYWNEADSTFLTATLALPAKSGPHPGVVLLSIAGTDPLVTRLVEDGYAVLMPVRRGFVSVEPLLQATYADLAGDARAAVGYLGARPDVRSDAIALVGQGDDAPAALLAAAESASPIPLILLEPAVLPGREVFRLEQRGQAARGRAGAAALEALDRYVDEIADIAMSDDPAYIREYRLQGLIGRSAVQLPYNAAFPLADGGQAHFLGSPLWRDRLRFDAEATLGRLHAPVLVIVGANPLDVPLEPHLQAVGRGLSKAGTVDAGVCVLEARPRHAFAEPVVTTVAEWLLGRVGPARERGAAPPGPPRALIISAEPCVS